jgi:hypothetical protein
MFGDHTRQAVDRRAWIRVSLRRAENLKAQIRSARTPKSPITSPERGRWKRRRRYASPNVRSTSLSSKIDFNRNQL